jgi:two-component system OmpR family response regulator
MTTPPNLLLVEDDQETRELTLDYLQSHGFNVTAVADGVDMRKALGAGSFSLILLDLMLPGENGVTLCRQLRAENCGVPIIMLTALGEQMDRILGLESGADDYLPKPFSPRELVARISAVLRRSANGPQPASERLAFAGFVVHLAERRLLDPTGHEIELTAGEYDLLIALAERPRRVLNRDQLIDLTRGRSAAPFDRSIDVHISRLRRKLRLAPDAADIIKTVRYGGYVFAAEISHSG